MLFDTYELRARVMPLCVALLPLIAPLFVMLNGATFAVSSSFLLLLIFALVFFLSQIVRDRGHAVQEKLREIWGDLPLAVLLRHRDGHLDPAFKAECQRRIQELKPEHALPSPEDEAAAPSDADKIYGRVADQLAAWAREKQIYFVKKENEQYGFRRNLLGVKSWCVINSAISFLIIALIVSLKVALFSFALEDAILATAAVIFITVYLVFIVKFVTLNWVSEQAVRYAKRLLESVESQTF